MSDRSPVLLRGAMPAAMHGPRKGKCSVPGSAQNKWAKRPSGRAHSFTRASEPSGRADERATAGRGDDPPLVARSGPSGQAVGRRTRSHTRKSEPSGQADERTSGRRQVGDDPPWAQASGPSGQAVWGHSRSHKQASLAGERTSGRAGDGRSGTTPFRASEWAKRPSGRTHSRSHRQASPAAERTKRSAPGRQRMADFPLHELVDVVCVSDDRAHMWERVFGPLKRERSGWSITGDLPCLQVRIFLDSDACDERLPSVVSRFTRLLAMSYLPRSPEVAHRPSVLSIHSHRAWQIVTPLLALQSACHMARRAP